LNNPLEETYAQGETNLVLERFES